MPGRRGRSVAKLSARIRVAGTPHFPAFSCNLLVPGAVVSKMCGHLMRVMETRNEPFLGNVATRLRVEVESPARRRMAAWS